MGIGSDNAYEPSAASRDERPVTESERLVPVKLRIPGLRENQIQDPINWKSAVANKIREAVQVPGAGVAPREVGSIVTDASTHSKMVQLQSNRMARDILAASFLRVAPKAYVARV